MLAAYGGHLTAEELEAALAYYWAKPYYYNDGWHERALGNPLPAIGQLARQLRAHSFPNTISAHEPPYLMKRRCNTTASTRS